LLPLEKRQERTLELVWSWEQYLHSAVLTIVSTKKLLKNKIYFHFGENPKCFHLDIWLQCPRNAVFCVCCDLLLTFYTVGEYLPHRIVLKMVRNNCILPSHIFRFSEPRLQIRFHFIPSNCNFLEVAERKYVFHNIELILGKF